MKTGEDCIKELEDKDKLIDQLLAQVHQRDLIINRYREGIEAMKSLVVTNLNINEKSIESAMDIYIKAIGL